MTHRPIRTCRAALIAASAIMLMLAGCAAQNGDHRASSGSSSPAGASSYDPYHYRCTGNCQAGS